MKKQNFICNLNFKALAFISYVFMLFWALINLFSPEQFKILTKISIFMLVPSIFIFLFNFIQVIVNKGKCCCQTIIFKAVVCICCACLLAGIGSLLQLKVVIRTFLILFFLISFVNYKEIYSLTQKIQLLNLFYWTFLLLLVLNLLIYGKLDPEFFFPTIKDKNYTGILMYFLLMLSFHKRNFIGILISSFYILFMTQSRSVYGMIVLYFIVKIFKTQIYSLLHSFHLLSTYKQFLVSFISIVFLSSFWVNYVSINPLSHYRQGLNDGSNKMRFVANIYAEQQILQDPKYLYKGLGDFIKETFGVAGEDTSLHTRFMGARLVQPHNCFLNMMIKIGVLEAILYFWILGKILDKIWSQENLEYYIPYLVNACFMHSLLDGPYLVIWTFILMTTREPVDGVRLCNYKIKMPFSISLGRSS